MHSFVVFGVAGPQLELSVRLWSCCANVGGPQGAKLRYGPGPDFGGLSGAAQGHSGVGCHSTPEVWWLLCGFFSVGVAAKVKHVLGIFS